MDFRELFLAQHARAHTADVGQADISLQDYLLKDLGDEQLRDRPLPKFNSLAWLFWHMTRVEDVGINLIITQRQQVLDDTNWTKHLNISHRDIGTGMTDQEVDDFNQKINIESLLEYRVAVGKQTQSIIRDLQAEVLDEKIDDGLIKRCVDSGAYGPNIEWVPKRWLGKPKGFTLMHTVLGHTYIHIGQCEDIRGLLGISTL